MAMPKAVNIIEVAPRDGLQNEKIIISTEMKLEFIQQLKESGIQTIEATSFVSPKKIPQLQDHKDVLSALTPNHDIRYPVLVPNMIGMEAAIDAGAQDIAVFTAASNTFSQKNTGFTIEQSLNQIKDIIKIAKSRKINVRAYISCITHCAFEGKINPVSVAEIAQQLYLLGADSISLGDTNGRATPNNILEVLSAVSKYIPIYAIALHCHNTYGQAIANIYAALEFGVSTFDSSAAGLGGCPFAPGASGNVATEDLIYLLEGLGINTNINMEQVIAASRPILKALNKQSSSSVNRALS